MIILLIILQEKEKKNKNININQEKEEIEEKAKDIIIDEEKVNGEKIDDDCNNDDNSDLNKNNNDIFPNKDISKIINNNIININFINYDIHDTHSENNVINYIKKKRKKKKRKKKQKKTDSNDNNLINQIPLKGKIFRKETNQYLKNITKINFCDDKSSKSQIDNKKIEINKDIFNIMNYTLDSQVNKKELNNIPYTQALRIDKRNYIEIFLSVLANEIDIISIFYYRNQYNQLSIEISTYVFELCLDLTLNCFLYTDDVVSEKYHNNGSIGFFTSLTLSFMSNIFSSIIAYFISKLVDYSELLEFILKDSIKQKEYFLNIIKFRKYLTLKLMGYYIVQNIFNFFMCYYLVIFVLFIIKHKEVLC